MIRSEDNPLDLKAHGGEARYLAAVKVHPDRGRKIQDPRRACALELPALDDRGRGLVEAGDDA